MTSVGFVVSIIFLILKLAAVGTFAAFSWWLVALPLLIGLGIDLLILIIFGATAFQFVKRH